MAQKTSPNDQFVPPRRAISDSGLLLAAVFRRLNLQQPIYSCDIRSSSKREAKHYRMSTIKANGVLVNIEREVISSGADRGPHQAAYLDPPMLKILVNGL